MFLDMTLKLIAPLNFFFFFFLHMSVFISVIGNYTGLESKIYRKGRLESTQILKQLNVECLLNAINGCGNKFRITVHY